MFLPWCSRRHRNRPYTEIPSAPILFDFRKSKIRKTLWPPNTDRFPIGVVEIQMLATIAWILALCDILVAVVSQVLLAEGNNEFLLLRRTK
jgi:hypothetical protein